MEEQQAYVIAAECLKPIRSGEIYQQQQAADKIAGALVEFSTPKHTLRDTIAIFAEAMELKLRRDDDLKSAWETELAMALLDQLWDEALELHDAFRTYHATAEDPEGKAVMMECVDVANFAMMIFSQIHPLTRHNRQGRAVHVLPRRAITN